MRCRQWLRGTAAVLGAGALWWGAAHLAAPAPAESGTPLWILKDSGGCVARYDAEGEHRLQVWPVYTALLPDEDLERLHEGIPVYSEQELRQLLEDFGA